MDSDEHGRGRIEIDLEALETPKTLNRHVIKVPVAHGSHVDASKEIVRIALTRQELCQRKMSGSPGNG